MQSCLHECDGYCFTLKEKKDKCVQRSGKCKSNFVSTEPSLAHLGGSFDFTLKFLEALLKVLKVITVLGTWWKGGVRRGGRLVGSIMPVTRSHLTTTGFSCS